ncbi:MAG: hypothetical protein ACYTDX_01420, partial [Planctomycetota bacterium]
MRPDWMRRDARDTEKGMVVYIFAIIVAIISLSFFVAMGDFHSLVRERSMSRASEASFWTAHGGVEGARASLQRDPTW